MLNVFLVVVAIVSMGSAIFSYTQKFRFSKIFAIICVITSMVCISYKVVPTGYTGVRTTIGQIDKVNMRNGLNCRIPVFQSIALVNNKQQDKQCDGEIWGESSEKTEVFAAAISVTYRINPEYSAYIYAMVNDYKRNLIPDTLVNSAVKSAMVELTDEQVTNRNHIEPLVKEKIKTALDEKYREDTVFVVKVSIDNMNFKEEYNQAIANKQLAKQEAGKQEIENQKMIDLAEANRKKADVEAVTKRIQAEADANARKIAADADAYAYKVKSEAITDNLLKKWEMDARIAHGWVTINGDNAVITDK